MNKGLEVIEAHWLFNCDYDNIQVVVHPQSVVHSMVEYKDASIIAQLGSQDMRLPIQYALNDTNREEEIAQTIDFYEISKLTFEKPDKETFRCLELAYIAGKRGGIMPAIVNAANEVAVALFLEKKIKFLEIAELIEEAMNEFEREMDTKVTINNVIEIDKKVRKFVLEKAR